MDEPQSGHLIYKGIRCRRIAEALPAATETDMAYFFERLDSSFPLKGYELRIAGDDPKAARKLLGKRFKQVICE